MHLIALTARKAPSHGDALFAGATPNRDGIAALQIRLAKFNRHRLEPGFVSADWAEALTAGLEAQRLEGEFVESMRASIQQRLETVPDDPSDFIAWFEDLRIAGPGQGHPLFPWLAKFASRSQLAWFLAQEIAGEAGFDDLVAMTQVKLPQRAKLEMARNYWDEMGRGNEHGMHGPLLDRLAAHFKLAPVLERTVPESLALSNLMVALAVNRRYTYQSVGALGVIELTAPSRAVQVNEGLRRVGVPAKDRNYFALHATLDVKHSAAWNREVIAPLVEADDRAARAIAEGALMRLCCGAACFDRYCREFGNGLASKASRQNRAHPQYAPRPAM